MSIYDIYGNTLSNAYGIIGNISSAVYDVNGILINGVSFLDNTILTDVYTSSIEKSPQGGCMDDDENLYVCFYATNTFYKYNLGTGANSEVNGGISYGHANGMTYNPNTNRLYVASMNSTGEVYVLDTSFNNITTLYARNGDNNVFNCWNIAYDRIAERFITISGGYIYFMDDDFSYVDSVPIDMTLWANTRQDIETDGNYIYCLSYMSNHIYVFDMNGNYIKDISNTAFSGEPESMCYDWINDVYYIEGKASSVYVIKQAMFKRL